MLHKAEIFILIILFPAFSCAATVGDEMTMTKQNLKGHEALYNEGWFVITSTKEAVRQGQEDSMAASQAISLAQKQASGHGHELGKSIAELKARSDQGAQDFYQSGSDRTLKMSAKANELWHQQWSYSKETYAKAYSELTLGYIEFGQKTSDDWAQLKKANSEFAHRAMHPLDEPDLKVLMSAMYQDAEKKSEEGVWSKSFQEAGKEFDQSYQESGKKQNSLAALGMMIWGDLKAAYYAIVEPSAISVGEGAEITAKGAQKVGAYLVGGTYAGVKIVGDLVYTTGLNLYYVSKVGYHVFAPTVEGGFLGSVALINSVTIPVVWVGGQTLGVANQVAVIAAKPAVGTGQFALATTAETAKYAALVMGDYVSGAGEVIAHEGRAVVVLGYNAITQIPSQTVLGVSDAVFLVWDGIHLTVAVAKGEVNGVPIGQVPVGTVMEAKTLEQKGIKIKKLSDDPVVIRKVLEAQPLDLSKNPGTDK